MLEYGVSVGSICRQFFENGIQGSTETECHTEEIKALLMITKGLGNVIRKATVSNDTTGPNVMQRQIVQDIVNRLSIVVNDSQQILPINLQSIASILHDLIM